MTATYTIRMLAEADLEAIWLYTCEEWNLVQADRYLEALISRLK